MTGADMLLSLVDAWALDGLLRAHYGKDYRRHTPEELARGMRNHARQQERKSHEQQDRNRNLHRAP